MPFDVDVLVIGGGAGGATFAHACATAGKSVLLVERGPAHPAANLPHDEQASLIDKRPYCDQTVLVNGSPKRLYVGGGLGGSTSLYGAALLRPSEGDFQPGRYYGQKIPRAIWDWPIGYPDLEPFYDEAEQLFGVVGASEDHFGPLKKPRRGFPLAPLPLQPINQKLMAANEASGLKPFRLPLAIDFGRCLRCGVCPGFPCPNGARRSSSQLLDRALAEGRRLQVLTDTEVERFSRDGHGQVDGVLVRDRCTGRQSTYRARSYALAAGAIGSPLLLLRSGIEGPQIGRNYMFHLSPIVAGIFFRRTGAEKTFIKQVGFADFYHGTPKDRHKLGIIQSLPVPGPLMLAKTASRRIPRKLLHWLRQRMLPLAGIVEDLPHPDNRISLGTGGTAELRHAFAPYDRERARLLAGLMKRILRRAGAFYCAVNAFGSDEHVAHQCGTLRFSKLSANGVADADCRLFQHPNVFVVDGSFFPTSLGVGPALTIMANALRVVRIVVRES